MKIYKKVQEGEIDMPKPPSPSLKPKPKKWVEKPKDQYLPSDAFSNALSKSKEEGKSPDSSLQNWPRPLPTQSTGFIERANLNAPVPPMMPPLFQNSNPSP